MISLISPRLSPLRSTTESPESVEAPMTSGPGPPLRSRPPTMLSVCKLIRILLIGDAQWSLERGAHADDRRLSDARAGRGLQRPERRIIGFDRISSIGGLTGMASKKSSSAVYRVTEI